MKEEKNIQHILEQALHAIENDNALPLKDLSNQTMDEAAKGDEDNLLVAVIIYSLGKILSRPDYRSLPGWNSFQRITTTTLKICIEDLKKNNIDKFRKDFIMIKKGINKVSGKLKSYIQDVFKNAEIAKASRVYEHGISAGKTAKMLGITLYDLHEYAGKTGISEVNLNQTINEKTRIKMVEDLFEK